MSNMTKMPEIFVSHMAKDIEYRRYFEDICNLAKTRPIFEELEQIVEEKISWQKIMEDIDRSKAVFVILSQNIQDKERKHTRDWIVWETGVAAAKKKDVWVLEPYSELGKISIVIPYLTQYMLFVDNNECKIYLKEIIESYSDRSISRPLGITLPPGNITPYCSHCFSMYEVHIPDNTNRFRCPSCNKLLEIEGLFNSGIPQVKVLK